jgi:pimeloyl-ACP methyl ester carboxylesterase
MSHITTKQTLLTTTRNIIIAVAFTTGLTACAKTDPEVKTPAATTQTETNTSTETVSYDYTSNWLNINVVNADKTQLPNLILIPGLVSSPEVWDGVVSELSKTHRLHLVQTSGFAGAAPASDVDKGVVNGIVADLAEYIKSQNLEHVTIMGHSMGGFSALSEALQHPNLVDKIIIVDSLPFYPTIFNPAATVETSMGQAQGMKGMLVAADDAQFEQMQKQGIGRLAQGDESRNEILAWSLSSDRATMAQAIFDLMTTDRRPDLKNIKTDTHVIYAWDTAMGFPAENMTQLYQSQYKDLENLHLTRIDKSYHFIMKDQPEAFLKAVQTALATE